MKDIMIYGLISSIEYQKARCCAMDLFKKNTEEIKRPLINGMLEFEWSEWILAKKKELKGNTWAFTNNVMIFIDGQLVGNTKDFLKWAQENYSYEDFRNEVLYETLSKEEYANYFLETKNDFVYLDIIQEDQKIGRLLIELFSNQLPKTSENFRLLCTGEKGRSEDGSKKLHYKNTLIHRIVPNGWIQGGDIGKGSGNESESTYGGLFEDESFQISNTKRGILGMANNGRHTNGSQFYITLQSTPWMDNKYVAFGQVVEGSETLTKLENLTTINERPQKECKINECGIFKYEF
ncbi:peptidyl-prolyl cis-trans isomerase-like 6 [Brachionus plicatilis]|uniref:Peptidyl-prolyl cis-trans isomerase n=1 Tax=Brachionus plicatilis TaxID=10195 RepID=A0A3M7R265_BRAPC|nr:peptidyl-prolyl cis-trans isomerase-like 6 [Brachionus plicatilis]